MESGGNVEMITNGDFESDNISNWSVLSWTGQTIKVEEDATTAIGRVSADKPSGIVYDLSGRRVMTPTKGVYIVDGKTVVY